MIELISKADPMLTDGMRITHCIFCTEKNCRHNIEAICTHRLPEIFGNPNFSMANEFICRSFEDKPKEETKASDIKITYKPVDKKDALRHLLACEDRFRGGCIAAEDMVRKIDSIYNTKEENKRIQSADISDINRKLSFEETDQSAILRMTAGNFVSCIRFDITKQEARELGQALIKMSEQ